MTARDRQRSERRYISSVIIYNAAASAENYRKCIVGSVREV